MDCYFIQIDGIPKEKVHPGFRSMESYNEPDTYSLFLSVKGRLANDPSKRANLDSYELAEALLAYWEPRLATRDWGQFSCQVRQERPDKWRERQIPKNSSEAISFLNSHANSPIRSQSQEVGNLVIAIEGVRSESFPHDVGYWSRHKKYGWVIASNLMNAQRYKSRTYCDKIISEKLSSANSKVKAKVHELTSSELREIQDKREWHWDAVFCRY